jgi:hypothetical protein
MRNLLVVLIFSLCACNKSESLSPLELGLFAPNPDLVTVKIKAYLPQSGKAFQNLFVSNDSVRVAQGQLWYSTSRDGFYDSVKSTLNSTFGFTITGPETVLSGFADLLLFDAGINLSQQGFLQCSSTLMLSSSNDAFVYNDDRLAGNPAVFLGLRDCDKVYMGLNPNLYDFNSDGIPDYLEMKCGMSPINKGIADVSTAGDGMLDIDKCKRHIPIDEDANLQPNQIFAYQYGFQLNNDGSTDFTIANIPILNGGAENLLTFTVTETDNKNGPAQIYTAYALLKSGYAGKTLQFQYWATAPANFYNQEVAVP